MRLKIREIHGAYIGRHCEVVGPLGQRVWPPAEPAKVVRPGDAPVVLGTNRDSCLGFVAGYKFARESS
jgi:hypothetical protein